MYQICISGSAQGESVKTGRGLAESVGKTLAKHGHSLLTGATSGIPELTAQAYKKANGKMSVGISPASTRIEHIVKYRLPTDAYDTILFTGLHYVGRDALLINSADAVISVGGRLGTLHEFTIAAETDTPIGILAGAGGIGDQIASLLKLLPNANPDMVIFEDDPDKLVAKLTVLLDKLHEPYKQLYE